MVLLVLPTSVQLSVEPRGREPLEQVLHDDGVDCHDLEGSSEFLHQTRVASPQGLMLGTVGAAALKQTLRHRTFIECQVKYL